MLNLKIKRKYILSIDSGSSSNRVAVVDEEGCITAFFSKPLTTFYPEPAFVEHDPLQIIQDIQDLLKQAVAYLKNQEILGIGLTNQRESIVIWDKNTGNPLYPCISWQDWRTEEYCQNLKNEHQQTIKEKTGLNINAYFSASKISWILENIKHDPDQIMCGTLDTWIIWNLTNKQSFCTDITNASRTLLMNLKTGKWDSELLKIFKISSKILPEIKSSCDLFGHWVYNHINNIPILGVIGDQQSSLLACGINKNVGVCTFGTGAFFLFNTGTKIIQDEKLSSTVAWKIKDEEIFYAVEASITNCGNIINWLNNNFIIDSFELPSDYQLDSSLFFLPFLNFSSSIQNDQKSCSMLITATYKTNSQDVLAASFQGIALIIAELIQYIKQKMNLKHLTVNGKMSDNNFFMQLQSNYCHSKLIKFKNSELSALGCAYLVGIYTGLWNLETINSLNQIEKTILPNEQNSEIEKTIAIWKKLNKYSQEIYKLIHEHE